jgi:hypothetical protein
MQMLEDVIQHVLLKHEVSTDQVLRPVLHSATGQPVHVWSVLTGNAFQHVGLEEVNDVEDQTKMRKNLFVPLRHCIRALLHLIYEDPQLVPYNSGSIQLQDHPAKMGDSSVAALMLISGKPCSHL